jgi:hypothetical protein
MNILEKYLEMAASFETLTSAEFIERMAAGRRQVRFGVREDRA